MKRVHGVMVLLLALAWLFVACGGGGEKTCSPACATGQVCITEGATPACKKSCTADSDCETGQECHKDEGTPHCDAAD